MTGPAGGDEGLLVHVDRESVAMGDDAVGHGQTWRLPPAATVLDLLLAVVERGFVPSVAGDVSWLLEVETGPTAPGRFHPPTSDVALLHVGPGRTVSVTPLVRPEHPLPLARFAGAQPSGPVRARLRYLSWAGRPWSVAEVAAAAGATRAPGADVEVVAVDDPQAYGVASAERAVEILRRPRRSAVAPEV